jgi:hypothetical protein
MMNICCAITKSGRKCHNKTRFKYCKKHSKIGIKKPFNINGKDVLIDFNIYSSSLFELCSIKYIIYNQELDSTQIPITVYNEILSNEKILKAYHIQTILYCIKRHKINPYDIKIQTDDIANELIKSSYHNYRLIQNPSVGDLMTAVIKSPKAINLLKHKSEELITEAINSNCYVFGYIEDNQKTKKMCDLAILKNSDLIRYVPSKYRIENKIIKLIRFVLVALCEFIFLGLCHQYVTRHQHPLL